MKRISSRDNPWLKGLCSLVEDHREPRRRGETLIDGLHLVQTCFERAVPVYQLILSESGLRNAEVRVLVERFEGEKIELTDALMRQVTGITSPVGIAAVIGIPETATAPISGDVLMLETVQDSGNVGTLLRTAAAAGVRDVLLSPGCAGAWTPRVLRAGQGGHFSLCIREQVDLVQALNEFGGLSIATVARDGLSLYEIDLLSPVAWLFGNEGSGLSAQVVANSKRKVSIPLAAGAESLNVAAAAAVCLFETCRQRSKA